MANQQDFQLDWSATAPAPTYHWSDNTDVVLDNDWRMMDDPLERRRTQNRIAQKIYRMRRRNERLGIASQTQREGTTTKRQQRNSTGQKDDDRSTQKTPTKNSHSLPDLPASGPSSPPKMTDGEKPTQQTPPSQSAPLPTPAPTLQTPILQPDMLTGSIPLHSPPLTENFNPYFAQPDTMLNYNPMAFQVATEPQSPYASVKTTDKFLLDRLRSQTDMLNKMFGLLEGHPNSNGDMHMPGTDFSTHPWLRSMPNAHGNGLCIRTEGNRFGHSYGHVPTDSDVSLMSEPRLGLDFVADTTIDSWDHFRSPTVRPSDLTSTTHTNGTTTTTSIPHRPHLTSKASSASIDVKSLVDDPSKQSQLQGLFESVMGLVERAGLQSFDALVTAYYSTTFRDSSPLANEQRLSRNRRLPRMISDVCGAATSWTTWEQRGLHEEIFKMTETMLKNEAGDARSSLIASATTSKDSEPSVTSPASSEHDFTPLKKLAQNKLPDLWTLMMALAGQNRDSWQHDCSDTVLLVVLLLHSNSRVPHQELFRLILGCFK